jgi:uncharacterized membrane protein
MAAEESAMRKWYPFALFVIAIIASIVAVSQMPDTVPVHFNLKGEADGWASRYLVGVLMPPLMAVIWAGMRFLPRLDPNVDMSKFQGSYDLIVDGVLTLMLVVHLMMLGSALGMPVLPGIRFVMIAAGMLLVVVGNVLPRARRNWIMGVRTRWTMSSDQAWARAQRAGGYALVAAGLVIIAGAFLPQPFSLILMVVAPLAASALVLVYTHRASKDQGGATA